MFWIGKKSLFNSKLFLVLILTVLVSHCLAQDSQTEESNQSKETSIYDEIPGIKIKDIKGIEKLLKESDMTYFVYYYTKASNNSRLGAEFLKSIGNKLKYLAYILLVDCEEVEPRDLQVCQKDPEAADGYPKMEVYSPPEFKVNPYTKEVNSHLRRVYDSANVSENSIYNFITQNIPARSTKLTPENFEMFANNFDLNKVILFTDKAKTPLLFRGLSTFFYNRLVFGEVEKSQTALIRKFKVNHFPTLILYKTIEDDVQLDEAKIEVFKGDIKVDQIMDFIGSAARAQPLGSDKEQDKTKPRSAFKTLKLTEINDHIKKFNEKRTVVYLNNQDDIPEDILKFSLMANGFFHFINFNCKASQSSEKYCQKEFKVNDFPTLLLFKNADRNLLKAMEKNGIVLPGDFHGIEREIHSHYASNFKEGNPQTFKALTNEARINKKIPFLYLHEGEIPMSLHLLSTEERYQRFIDFVVYEHPPAEFLHNLQIKKLPQMVVLLMTDAENSDQARVMTFNEELVYSRLSNFINQYFNNERQSKVNQVEEEKQDIAFISNNSDLKNVCSGKKKLCLIGFLDGRTNKDSIAQFDNAIKVLENVDMSLRKINRNAAFGWVNATCHTDFAANLNINVESLPNLVVYVPSKNLYTSLIGTFDQDTIVNFVERVMQGKVTLNNIQKEKMVITERTCEDIKEKVESDEDDELMREIIEEERKKREKFEQERSKEEGAGKKKKKKKKKADL